MFFSTKTSKKLNDIGRKLPIEKKKRKKEEEKHQQCLCKRRSYLQEEYVTKDLSRIVIKS